METQLVLFTFLGICLLSDINKSYAAHKNPGVFGTRNFKIITFLVYVCPVLFWSQIVGFTHAGGKYTHHQGKAVADLIFILLYPSLFLMYRQFTKKLTISRSAILWYVPAVAAFFIVTLIVVKILFILLGL